MENRKIVMQKDLKALQFIPITVWTKNPEPEVRTAGDHGPKAA
jgi:hypothetical protein